MQVKLSLTSTVIFAGRFTTTMLEERTQRARYATIEQFMGGIGFCRGTWSTSLTLTCHTTC